MICVASVLFAEGHHFQETWRTAQLYLVFIERRGVLIDHRWGGNLNLLLIRSMDPTCR